MDRRKFVKGSLETLSVAGGLAAAGTAASAGPGETPMTAASATPGASASLEPVLEPDLPIVDPHHHLWDHPARGGNPAHRYLLPDFLADVASGGHNIVETVFVECMSMYRADGPAELRSLGETEFVNGIAAMSASGAYGTCRVASGIVSFIDLRRGDAARPIIEAHRAAAGPRLKGVRNAGAWDEYPVMGIALDRARSQWLADEGTRRGVAALAAHELVFETWIFHTQLQQLAALAAAVPQATIVLGHAGTPIGVGPYAQRPQQVFDDWKRDLRELARRPNVVVKLGGFGMAFVSPALAARKPQASSEDIARAWRPWFETCIELFGPERCMFESNFPPDAASCSYRVLWNAFKRIAGGYSAAEKTALFSGTARRVFRLGGG